MLLLFKIISFPESKALSTRSVSTNGILFWFTISGLLHLSCYLKRYAWSAPSSASSNVCPWLSSHLIRKMYFEIDVLTSGRAFYCSHKGKGKRGKSRTDPLEVAMLCGPLGMLQMGQTESEVIALLPAWRQAGVGLPNADIGNLGCWICSLFADRSSHPSS